MFTRFFIDRPIFATVLSVLITLVGCISLTFLPIAQYPRITPPGVAVSISYPGASSQVVADTVAAPIEQQVNGVPGMLYMSSQMGNDGTYTLTVTFDIGVDLKTALVMVQNRVTLAMPQLPIEVQNQGITIRKKTPDLLMIVNFFSPNGRYDDIYLSNYATINVKDELLRVPGVSDISYQGQRDYSIRAWLDPQKLAAKNMTAIDVAQAIRDQNLDAPAGQVGSPPSANGQTFQMPVNTIGRLQKPEEFGDIIIKVGQSKAVTATTSGTMAAPASGSMPTMGGGSGGGNAGSGGSTSGSGGTTSGGSTSGSTPSSTTPATTTGTTGTVGSTGGANSTGGATTGGGANTGGGATTGAGSMGASNGSSAPATGLSVASGMSSNLVGSGILTGQTLGRGPSLPDASIVRLRDVARMELGAQNYNISCIFDGKPSVGLGLYQLPGTNALDVANAVRAKMEELKERFPDGVAYEIGYDTTPYISESVWDVVKTLLEAVFLVGLVVLLFLQDWRTMILPMIDVPVSLIGTFAVMAALGYSLNNISLFGLVLAIGIVVDDAIVVLENIERLIATGLDARTATLKAMEEVTFPIIAVGLVLCAVFLPCAFIGGITGQFFRQFGVTIAVSTVISAINAVTMTPSRAVLIFKNREGNHGHRPNILFRAFNYCFDLVTAGYGWTVGKAMRLSAIVLLLYGGLLVLTWWVFQVAPTGFIPQQDQGRLIVNIQLPDSASLERTQATLAEVDEIARKTDGVAHAVGIAGLSFLLQADSPNFASMFIVLKPFSERQKPELRDTAIMAKLRKAWNEKIKDGQVTVYGSSPVPGLGVAGGFKIIVEDRGDLGLPILQNRTDDLVKRLKEIPGLNNVATQFRSRTPQIDLEIDRTKVAALGVSLNDVNQTLAMYLGSLYVNSYNDFGRHWQVTIQAEGDFRNQLEDINLLQVRNNQGQMVQMGTLLKPKPIGGPISVTRYNLYRSASINGNIQTGYSTGDAIKAIQQAAGENLPISMKAEWTELMFMQIRAGNTAMIVFFLGIICVFLALAALYESWALPLAVILVVPLCSLCSGHRPRCQHLRADRPRCPRRPGL
jgi:multidrug efflux pump